MTDASFSGVPAEQVAIGAILERLRGSELTRNPVCEQLAIWAATRTLAFFVPLGDIAFLNPRRQEPNDVRILVSRNDQGAYTYLRVRLTSIGVQVSAMYCATTGATPANILTVENHRNAPDIFECHVSGQGRVRPVSTGELPEVLAGALESRGAVWLH